ncbi:hypothetical protein LOD99_738 [Oopsacas minuta]|uniref:Uncharacterized protein n=1 Tax=Oopsacas minuta TaxID=111878 RepID=A0AAV7K254_9METZ|nr:hypothetical protein LOD99_738 [Oopsacas minuta]
MATAQINENLASGPVSLIPVSNKLQDRMNILREVIDRNKSLVRKICEDMKQLIEEKVQLIIRELETIWDEANQRMNFQKEEIHKKIEELNKHRTEMEKIFKDLDPSLPNPLNQIPEAIESVKRRMNIDIPYIKLNWKVKELKDSINTFCASKQRYVKFEDNIPITLKWSPCDQGKQDNQLEYPWGIAIDSIEDRIYVADWNENRVQIFSGNGGWIKSLKDEQMTRPQNFLILHNFIFVQCFNVIIKFNKSTYQKVSCKFLDHMSGICTDNTHVFLGEYNNVKLSVLTMELVEENNIQLYTEFNEDTKLQDISPARDVFYIAFKKTDYPIQAFSKQGNLLRCIIHKEFLEYVRCFCLDQQLNILITLK